MRCIAGNEQTSCVVSVGDGKAQIPKADVLKIDFKFGTYGLVKVGAKIEVIGSSASRHRRMKKPSIAKVNTAKELPVAFKLWVQHVVKRFAWETRQ